MMRRERLRASPRMRTAAHHPHLPPSEGGLHFRLLQDREVGQLRGLGARRRGFRPGVAPLFHAVVWALLL
eukprot:9786369-Alexandrium_andersonii.AAC.1